MKKAICDCIAEQLKEMAKSILRKAGGSVIAKSGVAGMKEKGWEELCMVLSDDAAYALLKTLMGYADAVEKAAQKYEPSVLARYVIDVATAFNRFYHNCPILQAEEAVKLARLKLVEITCNMIEDVCGLLGMKCPEEM